MASIKTVILASFIIACTVSNFANSTEVKKNEDSIPVALNSRFFDLGGIFSHLFPDLNQGSQGGFQGSQGGYGRNPNEMDFPTNSQIYPPVTQEQKPELPVGQGNTWPVIDDAKLYPNQRPIGGGQQNKYPSNGNSGGQPSQYPNGGNVGGSQPMQYPNGGNFGGSQPMQYPNGGNFGGSQPTQYPNGGNVGGSQPMQYPNGGNVGGSQPMQYPNGGNFGGSQPTQYPKGGNFGGSQPTQYPNGGNFGGAQPTQFPNGGDFGGSRPTQYPSGGNFGGAQNGGNFGGSQYPNQGGFTNQGNQNNNRPGSGQSADGTIDGLIPPQQSMNPGNTQNRPTIQNPGEDNQFDNNPEDITAILGRPVKVPQTAAPADQIFFPTSTDNSSQKQCVQDCQSTSEYSPVCGTNNVTYINPGKFVCARNCGINVFIAKQGRCPKDTPWPPNVISVTNNN